MQEYAQKSSPGHHITPIGAHVPGSELLEALLAVAGIRAQSAGGAEAVDGSRGRDHGWDSVKGVCTARGQAAQAIGTEEGGWLRTSCDSQYRGRRH